MVGPCRDGGHSRRFAAAEVQFAFADASGNLSWQSFVFGDVDHVSFDPIGRSLNLHGRDLIGRLVAYKIRDNWPNKTS